MKNNLQKNKLLVATLVALSGLCLFGCGAKNTSNSSPDTSAATASTANKPSAFCNKATKDDVTVRLMAYSDTSGNKNSSLIRLKFANVPSEYLSAGWDIHIVKWTASSTGVVRPAANETKQFVNTRFDHKYNGVYNAASNWNYNLACDTCPTLEWSNLKLIASSQGQTFNDANTFFNEYHLLLDLQDNSGDWKGLTVMFVNSAGAAMRTVDLLIPSFDANPADYQATHPAILANLHPFLSMLNQGWTASQFQTESQALCF